MTEKPLSSAPPSGTLYVVATPIGNPEDITLRALRVLGEVDWVAAEDTRLTGRMLRDHRISTQLISFFEHNEQRRTEALIQRLAAGETGALVSSAGSPTVSDPGYRLVSAAVRSGIRVVPVPGATAATAALSASGLPTDAFVFVGFAPKKPAALRRFLEELATERKTLVFYESPLRIVSLLQAAEAAFSDRDAVLAREMTKAHEEFVRGRLSEIRRRLAQRAAVKGECTLLVAGAPEAGEPDDAVLQAAVGAALDSGMGVSEAAKTIAHRHRTAKRRVYALAVRIQKQKGNG